MKSKQKLLAAKAISGGCARATRLSASTKISSRGASFLVYGDCDDVAAEDAGIKINRLIASRATQSDL